MLLEAIYLVAPLLHEPLDLGPKLLLLHQIKIRLKDKYIGLEGRDLRHLSLAGNDADHLLSAVFQFAYGNCHGPQFIKIGFGVIPAIIPDFHVELTLTKKPTSS